MDPLAVNGPPVTPLVDVDFESLERNLEKLCADDAAMSAAIQSFRADQVVANNFYGVNQNPALMDQQALHECDLSLADQYVRLTERKNALIVALGNILVAYGSMQNHVVRVVKIWERRLALSAYVAPYRDNFVKIQCFVETLMVHITNIIDFANILLYFGVEPTLTTISNQAHDLRNFLILSTFIVETQPPQVIKKNIKFAARVRWLIGEKLDIHRSKPKIMCEILSEAQAKHLVAQNIFPNIQIPPASTGKMTGKECLMDYDNTNRILAANFKSLIITDIQRSERRASEIVMDEKCTLLFYTTITCNGYEITCWTLSLPLVVVVHGNQEPQALATIIWDNVFSDLEREPFQVPDRVHYKQLLEALAMKFAHCTGCHLTTENLEFLREKLLSHATGQNNEFVTYTQFCRDSLAGNGFTFWLWFYAIMKLTKEHLQQMWKDGLLLGFINKRKVFEEILPFQKSGTFLLRFSDSIMGSITLSFRDNFGNIQNVAPWTRRDLLVVPLANRLRDFTQLECVYPKLLQLDLAFGRFYTQATVPNGYVGSAVACTVQPQPDQQNSDDIDSILEALGSGEESASSFNSYGTSNISAQQPVQCFGW